MFSHPNRYIYIYIYILVLPAQVNQLAADWIMRERKGLVVDQRCKLLKVIGDWAGPLESAYIPACFFGGMVDCLRNRKLVFGDKSLGICTGKGFGYSCEPSRLNSPTSYWSNNLLVVSRRYRLSYLFGFHT